MRSAIRRTLVAAIAGALALALVPASPAGALTPFPQDPNRLCGWPIAYPGDANYAYPDTSAAYFVQSAILAPGDQIVIRGTDPKARYWSLQTYRFSDSTLLDSVNDVTVRRGRDGGWTIRVVSPEMDDDSNPNVLTSTGPSTGAFLSNLTVVMYRVYASRTATASGGALPAVTLKDASAGTTQALETCVGDQVGPPSNRPVLEAAEGVDTTFVRGAAARFYPSADTAYLVAQAPYKANRILVMTGKAPRTPKDVRYWSVCQNVNAGDLPVIDCLRDNEIATGKDRRYAIAVVGAGQVPQRTRKHYAGVSFLEWGDTTADAVSDAFLIYRNILSSKSFKGSVDRVPVGKPGEPRIGDFAPRLRYVSVEKFKATYAAHR